MHQNDIDGQEISKPPKLLLSGYHRHFPSAKWSRLQADNSSPSITEVNNEWVYVYISAAAYTFLVWKGKNLLILYLKPSMILEFNFWLCPVWIGFEFTVPLNAFMSIWYTKAISLGRIQGLYRYQGWHWRVNPLNAELNPICHLLALFGAHHILHVSRIRVKHFNPYPTNVENVSS